MREKIIFLSSCLLATIVYPVFGQDTLNLNVHQLDAVEITSTRFELLPEEDGRNVTRIGSEELKMHAGKTLAEILSEVPGLHIDGSYSAEGSNLSYYLRGGKNGQILVLIDGIPVNDPSDINNSFDFRQLNIEDIESIEIVRGGMSTLYGSDALAGVISIRLKKAGIKSFQGQARFSLGSYRTLAGNLNFNGKSDRLKYLVNMTFYGSGGFTAAVDSNLTPLVDSAFVRPVRDFDRDGILRQNILTKFDYTINKQFSISSLLKFDNYDAQIDNEAFTDDENRSYLSQEWLISLTPTWTYERGESALKLSFNNVSRYDINDSSEYIASPPMFSYLNGYTYSHYTGMNLQMEWTNKIALGKRLKFISGILFKKLAYGSKNTLYGDWTSSRAGLAIGTEIVLPSTTGNVQADPFINFLFSGTSGFHISAGARLNYHSDYGTHFVWSANPSWLISLSGNTKLKWFGSASSSFEAPSLYQLYSIYGNTALQAMSSLNYESGLVLYINQSVESGLDFFNRKESNLVTFGLNGYENGGERTVQGIEYYVDWTICDFFKTGASAAFMQTDDSASFYRVPRLQYGAYANYAINKKTNVDLRFNYTGARYQYDWNTASEMLLPAYSLLDLNVNHRFKNGFDLFGSLNNVLNNHITSVYGFSSKGRNITIGVRYHFK